MKVVRFEQQAEVDGVVQNDRSYQVIEATPEEEAELMAQPPGTANEWVEANAEIVELTEE